MSPEGFLTERITDIGMIVNLTIEYDMIASAFRRHGLMSCRRKIDDRKTAMAEDHMLTCRGEFFNAPVIRSAPGNQIQQIILKRKVDASKYSAHKLYPKEKPSNFIQ